MKGQIIIITPDSTEATVERRDMTAPPSLPELQELVGGYIELAPMLNHFMTPQGLKPCVAFWNEDGRMLKLPRNNMATAIWSESVPELRSQPIVGNVVVLIGDDEFMASL